MDTWILAGRAGKILDIDHEGQVLTVAPSPAAAFRDFRPMPDKTFTLALQMNESLLERTDIPIYLDMKAREMLIQARAARLMRDY